MNDKELYALCYELMADDNPNKPVMQPVNRKFLARFANEQARDRKFDSWIEWYMQAEMPFTEEDVKGVAS
jgi:hypothetical protein